VTEPTAIPPTLRRGIESRLRHLVGEHPVVVLEGARAVGKTTLAQALLADRTLGGRYIPLDTELALAAEDPDDWLRTIPPGSVIDEAQLVPQLLLAIKRSVDRDPRPGRFLLTGSSRLRRDTLGGSDALAGRAARVTLMPLTISETEGEPRSIIHDLRHGDPLTWQPQATDRDKLVEWIIQGGMPGGLGLSRQGRVERFGTYPDRALGPETVGSRRHSITGRLLSYVLKRSPVPENTTQLARELGISRDTVLSHLDLLEEAMVMWRQPGYSPTPGTGAVKRARLIAFDTGIGCVVDRLGLNVDNEGSAAETLVANELRAQTSWTSEDVGTELMHWRFKNRAEVDIVLAHPDGDLVAIEVKTSTQARPEHTKWLSMFRERYQRDHRRVRTYVFYLGSRVVSYDRHWFVPLSIIAGV